MTAEVGLDHRRRAGPTGDYFMPQVMGSGVAVFDADGDGRLDILVQHAGPNGRAPPLPPVPPGGRFRDVSVGSGLDVAGYGMGVAVGDFDNDGRPDVLITEYGGGRLFRNNGDGKFEDVTARGRAGQAALGHVGRFLDYDRDGWLDLVVVNYVDYDPSMPRATARAAARLLPPAPVPRDRGRLFRNRGRGRRSAAVRVRGRDRRQRARARSPATAWAWSARLQRRRLAGHLRGQRRQPNHLWINQERRHLQGGSGVAAGWPTTAGQAQANMGIALGDVDGDGLPDLFATHLTEELAHALASRNRPAVFRDADRGGRLASPAVRGTGFGTAAADFDHDGWPDLAVVNGRVSDLRANPPRRNPRRPAGVLARLRGTEPLFAGPGGGEFKDIVPRTAPRSAGRGRVPRAGVGRPRRRRGHRPGHHRDRGPGAGVQERGPKKGHWLVGPGVSTPTSNATPSGAVVTVQRRRANADRLVCPGRVTVPAATPESTSAWATRPRWTKSERTGRTAPGSLPRRSGRPERDPGPRPRPAGAAHELAGSWQLWPGSVSPVLRKLRPRREARSAPRRSSYEFRTRVDPPCPFPLVIACGCRAAPRGWCYSSVVVFASRRAGAGVARRRPVRARSRSGPGDHDRVGRGPGEAPRRGRLGRTLGCVLPGPTTSTPNPSPPSAPARRTWIRTTTAGRTWKG